MAPYHRTPYLHLRRVSAPDAEIISLAEAKLYLRVDHSDEDLLISELIVAVRQFSEDYLGQSLVTQDWLVEYNCPQSVILLPMAPVLEILEVRHEDIIISADTYTFNAPQTLALLTQQGGTLSVRYRAGEDSINQPYALKQAMLAHIALCYEQRGMDLLQPVPAHRLYDAYKQVRI